MQHPSQTQPTNCFDCLGSHAGLDWPRMRDVCRACANDHILRTAADGGEACPRCGGPTDIPGGLCADCDAALLRADMAV